MKYLNRQEGIALPLAIILVACITVVIGLAVWQSQNARSSRLSASPAVTASPTTTAMPTPTDRSLILITLKAHYSAGGYKPTAGTKINLNRLEGNYALASTSSPTGASGGEVFLKKGNGGWAVTYETQNEQPSEIAKLALPQDFLSTTPLNTVLYTY